MTTLERLTLHIRQHGKTPRDDARSVLDAATGRFADGIYPPAWSHATEGRDPARMQTQCLLEANPGARIDVMVRFRHVVSRALRPVSRGGDAFATSVDTASSWVGTAVRQIFLPDLVVADVPQCVDRAIHVDRGSTEEEVRDSRGELRALLVRSWEALRGRVVASSVPVGPNVQRISVAIDNTTCWSSERRDEARRHALLAAKTEIEVQRGALVSLCDPPEHLRALAESCRNLHTWPVLVGTPGERTRMLSSPEILFDYPELSSVAAALDGDGAADREQALHRLASAHARTVAAPTIPPALRPSLIDEQLAVAESARSHAGVPDRVR